MKKINSAVLFGLVSMLFSINVLASNTISFTVPGTMMITCNMVSPPWYLSKGNNAKSYVSFAKKFGIKNNATFSCFVKNFANQTALRWYGTINSQNNTIALQGSGPVSPFSVTWKNSQGVVIQPSQKTYHSGLQAIITG